jgi:hypothetical protein
VAKRDEKAGAGSLILKRNHLLEGYKGKENLLSPFPAYTPMG